ncbi:putative ribonuclease H-like domain-containing protein [Tanacetum coccineum]
MNLTKLINSQISAKDKVGLSYDSQINKNEVVHSVFNSRESDMDDCPVNDRFKTGERFHAVPPPYTGNNMPSRPNLSFAGLDDSVYKTKVSETETNISKTSKDNVEKPKIVRPSAPIIIATKLGQVPVNAAKQNSPRAASSISTARPVNSVVLKSKANVALPKTYYYFKAHSLVRRAFNQKSAAKIYNLNEKVNTTRVNNVTTAGPKAVVRDVVRYGENAIKSSTCWIWRPTENVIDHTSKDSGSYMFKRFDYVDLQGRLKHMTRHKFPFLQIIKRLMVGLLHLEEVLKENRVLVTKPHNKTPYELLLSRPPSICFMRPFGCPMPILNTLDPLSKFNRKADEGLFLGYSINNKPFRVFNTRTRKVKENLHITFLENKPNVAGSRPDWLFDIDLLTNSMNYEPVTAGNQTNKNACIKYNTQQYILLPLLYDSPKCSEDAVADDAGKTTKNQQIKKEGYANSTNKDSTISPSVSAAGQSFTTADDLPTDPLMLDLEDTTNLLNIGIFSGAYDDEDMGAEADLNNLETTMNVSPIPTTRIHKDHPKDQIIGDINSATQTRRMTKISEELAMKVTQALTDPSWIEAMQDELLQFSLQKVWRLVDLPKGKHAIGTKWVYRNKKDERGIVVRNKARLVAQDAIIFGSTKKSLYVKFERLMHKKFQMSSIGELTFSLGLQVMQRDNGIFISQDKYVADILKKFDSVTMKIASTPREHHKNAQDGEAEDVDVHLYRLMIGSLMYFIASRPDITFAVCACARFQITPKVSHLHAVKRIFRYLKGQPKLGIWYPRDSPFDLEAFFDISNSTTEAEYVAAVNCYGQVLWIQNQMLDYGFNFMNTKIYIDNESTICIMKNPVFYSKTKHIEIRHHFIRYSYEKRLIQVIKIHTDHNVADLLTKAFDVSSIRDKFGNKTGSCKVNTARQAKHIEYMSRMDGRTCNIKQKCVKSQIPKRGRDTKIPQSGGPPKKVGDEAVHKELGDRMERAATTASSLEAEQDSDAQPSFETTSKWSNDPPLSRVYTLGSG